MQFEFEGDLRACMFYDLRICIQALFRYHKVFCSQGTVDCFIWQAIPANNIKHSKGLGSHHLLLTWKEFSLVEIAFEKRL